MNSFFFSMYKIKSGLTLHNFRQIRRDMSWRVVVEDHGKWLRYPPIV